MDDKIEQRDQLNKLLWKAATEGVLAEVVFDALEKALDTPVGNDPVNIMIQTLKEWEI